MLRVAVMLSSVVSVCARGSAGFVASQPFGRVGLRSVSPAVNAQARRTVVMNTNNFQLEGIVKQMDDLVVFESGFSKREFVMTVSDGPYDQHIKFQTTRERTRVLDDVIMGDRLLVSFNIRGNEWQDKHFVNLEAWRVERMQSAPPPLDDAPDYFGAEAQDDPQSGGEPPVDGGYPKAPF